MFLRACVGRGFAGSGGRMSDAAGTARLDTSSLRKEYMEGSVDERDAPADPMLLFAAWLQQAIDAGLPEPYAMTLSTATLDGVPSARIVLLRAAEAGRFTFYTNYESRKGRELALNPHASLLFYWAELERQVRIDGTVRQCDAAESDAYFAARPYANRIGAWASRQSRVIGDRAGLEAKVTEFGAKYPESVPRPPYWGGYRLTAQGIEFWQGRPSRLHDRLRYRLRPEGDWQRERLAP